MPFDLAVIDLDNTLYEADSGVFARMDKRMTAFVQKELGVDEAEANRLRLKYWKDYGTTLRGMMLHHGMEPEAFLHDVHDVGAHEILSYDAELDAALARLPCRKVIHTNGIREHADRILNALGIAHHFERIYDIRYDNYLPKPNSAVLQKLLDAEGVEPSRTLVVDDMVDNLKAAHDIGCKTIWITRNPDGRWDFHLPAVHHLPAHFGH